MERQFVSTEARDFVDFPRRQVQRPGALNLSMATDSWRSLTAGLAATPILLRRCVERCLAGLFCVEPTTSETGSLESRANVLVPPHNSPDEFAVIVFRH